MTAADAWRRLPDRAVGRTWPTTWARAVMSTTRAVGHAGTVLFHATVLGPTRVRCLMMGHVDRFSREAGRLCLRCDECGRSTPGWTIGPARPRLAPRAQRLSVPLNATRRDAFRIVRGPFPLITPAKFR